MEKELKTLLRKLAAEYETKDFINDDPVRFAHAYADKQDGQTVGAYLTKPNSEESARFTIRVNY